MELIISGQKLRFRGTITVVSADNLSAQLMGGYKALNAAFRKCRYCMATDDTMQSKVHTSIRIIIAVKNLVAIFDTYSLRRKTFS